MLTTFLFGFTLLAIQWQVDISPEEIAAEFAYPHSQYFSYKGMKIHYCVEGSGDALLLVHGTASSLHTWQEWCNRLSKSFKIIRLDLPGFGLTGPNPSKDYSEKFYAETIEALLKHLQIEKVHIAGNSLGGNVAFHFAALYPEKTKSLILIDASGYQFGANMPLMFKLVKNPFIGFLMTHISPRIMYKWNIEQIYGNPSLISENLIDRYFKLALREGNRQAMVDRMRQIKDVNSTLIKQIEAPSLIIWGEKDEWIPLRFATQFHRDIPNSKLLIFPGAGHVPMEEIPIPTADSTLAFIQALKAI